MATSVSPPIRILLSGPGLIGKRHCELVHGSEDCVLQAIVAPSAPEHDEAASSFGTRRYDTIEDALENETIDAAIISSPNECHFQQALTCLNRRIPTLVEKPLTDNTVTARQLIDAADEAKVPLMVGHHRMHSPLIKSVKECLDANRLGKLVSITGSALFYKPRHYFVEGPWRTRKGGGPLLINMIHEVGLLRFFAGEIAEVTALASSETRQYEVEDSVSIAFRFKSGALGTFILSDTAASSKSWEMTSGENSAYPHYPQEDCYHIAGTLGSIDFPTMRMRRYASADDASWNVPFLQEFLACERADPLRNQMQNLTDVVRGRTPPVVTGLDGYKNMLVIEAIAQSIQQGRATRVREP